MNISSKITVRTLVAGVVLIAISSLSSLAFTATAPAPSACTNTYMQTATASGQTLSAALDKCYVNRPAGAVVQNCVQGAFQAHYRTLIAAINTFQSCSGEGVKP
ncbi:hypothetical protein [Methylomicrobium lacus]|uniref:hypothetical protein n=1 Tax=Methylomicrobium lacus TaxID=136992 RepID=UPI0035A963A7